MRTEKSRLRLDALDQLIEDAQNRRSGLAGHCQSSCMIRFGTATVLGHSPMFARSEAVARVQSEIDRLEDREQTRNLEIPRCAIAHWGSAPRAAPERLTSIFREIHLSATVGMQQRPLILGAFLMRAAAAILILLLLAGCATEAPVEAPSMYADMAVPGARLDPLVAATMISLYRHNNGLGSVQVDPELTKLAELQAQAMASANKMDHDVRAPLGKRLNAAGYPANVAVENISAGYHTLAEAFSGWRDSPPHRANMLKSGVTKLGIAASYAPNTKYKVFWTLILASTDA